MRFRNPFKKSRYPNPAIDDLFRKQGEFDPALEKIVSSLPDLADAIRQGASALLQKTLIEQIAEYDKRTGRELVKRIDEDKSEAMLQKLTSMMLLTVYEELAAQFQDPAVPSYLTSALHYDLYKVIPGEEGFVEYLHYQNPHFDDPAMAPAHKFGNDIAAILSISDQLFYLIIAQQAVVISDVSKQLIRWVLFDEEIVPPASTQ